MGDQITTAGDQATLLPPSQIQRILTADGPINDKIAAFATSCRLNALGMIHLAGSGHIGSTFSSLDIVSYLLLDHLGDDDVYFSSKGHDVPGYYAALLGLGRLDWSLVTRLRRLGGLPGHPDIHTPGIMFNTGSLGMGISKAKGLIAADRLKGRERRVVVLTGDGELQEGQIWESLATAVRDQMHELTAVVDHNRLQSDLPVSHVSDLGDLDAKFAAFGWHVERIDGHDVDQLRRAFNEEVDGPKVIIAETVKGAGVSFTEHTAQPPEQWLYPYHSGALPEGRYAAAVTELTQRLNDQFAALAIDAPEFETAGRDTPRVEISTAPTTSHNQIAAYGRALVELATERDDIVVLDADLMLDCGLIPFREKFPDRYIECGIAEQDMVSQASGLAAGGMLPIVNSFGAFLSQRPSEQIANAASEGRKIIYMGSLAGLIPAGPGHSHQALRDIASFGSVPSIEVIAPCTEQQVEDAVRYAVHDAPGSVYLRLSPLTHELPFPDHGLQKRGHGTLVHEGDGTLTVIAYGATLLVQAWQAITGDDELQRSVTLINMPWVARPDAHYLSGCSGDSVVILDDHQPDGGLGERVFRGMNRTGMAGARTAHLGVEGIAESGQPTEVLGHHSLDVPHLQAAFRRLMQPRVPQDSSVG